MAMTPSASSDWQALGQQTCQRCGLKTSDQGYFQAHHCRSRASTVQIPESVPISPARNLSQVTMPATSQTSNIQDFPVLISPPTNLPPRTVPAQIRPFTGAYDETNQITAGIAYNRQTQLFTCSLCQVDLEETEFVKHLESHLIPFSLLEKLLKAAPPMMRTEVEQLRKYSLKYKLSERAQQLITMAKNGGKYFYKPFTVDPGLISRFMNFLNAPSLRNTFPQQVGASLPVVNQNRVQLSNSLNSNTTYFIPVLVPGLNSAPVTVPPQRLVPPPAHTNQWNRSNISSTHLDSINYSSSQSPAKTQRQGALMSPNRRQTILRPEFNRGMQRAQLNNPFNHQKSSVIIQRDADRSDETSVSGQRILQTSVPVTSFVASFTSMAITPSCSVANVSTVEERLVGGHTATCTPTPSVTQLVGSLTGEGAVCRTVTSHDLATVVNSKYAKVKNEGTAATSSDVCSVSLSNNVEGTHNVHQTVVRSEERQPSTQQPDAQTEHSCRKQSGDNNFHYLLVVKGHFLCLKCRMKWHTDNSGLFFRHIWKEHAHDRTTLCCNEENFMKCTHLRTIICNVYERSPDPMPKHVANCFTSHTQTEENMLPLDDIPSIHQISTKETQSSPSQISDPVYSEQISSMDVSAASITTGTSEQCLDVSSSAQEEVNRPSETLEVILSQDQPADTAHNNQFSAVVSSSACTSRDTSVANSINIESHVSSSHGQVILSTQLSETQVCPREISETDQCNQTSDTSCVAKALSPDKSSNGSSVQENIISHQQCGEGVAHDTSRLSNTQTQELGKYADTDLPSCDNHPRLEESLSSIWSPDELNGHVSMSNHCNISEKQNVANISILECTSEKETVSDPEKERSSPLTAEYSGRGEGSLMSTDRSIKHFQEKDQVEKEGMMSLPSQKNVPTVLKTPEKCAAVASTTEGTTKFFFQCGFDKCSYTTQTSADLDSHMKTSHPHGCQFICRYCQWKNHSMNGLLQHLESHLGNKRAKTYSCALLENSEKIAHFEHESIDRIIKMLETNMNAADGVDTHFQCTCNVCDTVFASAPDLKLHLQKSLLKVIQCKYCESCFLDTSSWQKHMLTDHDTCPRMYNINEKLLCHDQKVNQPVCNQPPSVSHLDINSDPMAGGLTTTIPTASESEDGMTVNESDRNTGTCSVLEEYPTNDTLRSTVSTATLTLLSDSAKHITPAARSDCVSPSSSKMNEGIQASQDESKNATKNHGTSELTPKECSSSLIRESQKICNEECSGIEDHGEHSRQKVVEEPVHDSSCDQIRETTDPSSEEHSVSMHSCNNENDSISSSSPISEANAEMSHRDCRTNNLSEICAAFPKDKPECLSQDSEKTAIYNEEMLLPNSSNHSAAEDSTSTSHLSNNAASAKKSSPLVIHDRAAIPVTVGDKEMPSECCHSASGVAGKENSEIETVIRTGDTVTEVANLVESSTENREVKNETLFVDKEVASLAESSTENCEVKNLTLFVDKEVASLAESSTENCEVKNLTPFVDKEVASLAESLTENCEVENLTSFVDKETHLLEVTDSIASNGEQANRYNPPTPLEDNQADDNNTNLSSQTALVIPITQAVENAVDSEKHSNHSARDQGAKKDQDSRCQLQCYECNHCSISEDEFYNHVISRKHAHAFKHSKQDQSVKCAKCAFLAQGTPDLVNHIIEVHYNETKSSSSDSEIAFKLSAQPDNGTALPSFVKLTDICGTDELDLPLKSLYHQVASDLFVCLHCTSQFTTRKQLHGHLFFCLADMGVGKCIECDYQGEQIKDISRHHKEDHKINDNPSVVIYRVVKKQEFLQALKSKNINLETFKTICAPFNEPAGYLKSEQPNKDESAKSESNSVTADTERSMHKDDEQSDEVIANPTRILKLIVESGALLEENELTKAENENKSEKKVKEAKDKSPALPASAVCHDKPAVLQLENSACEHVELKDSTGACETDKTTGTLNLRDKQRKSLEIANLLSKIQNMGKSERNEEDIQSHQKVTETGSGDSAMTHQESLGNEVEDSIEETTVGENAKGTGSDLDLTDLDNILDINVTELPDMEEQLPGSSVAEQKKDGKQTFSDSTRPDLSMLENSDEINIMYSKIDERVNSSHSIILGDKTNKNSKEVNMRESSPAGHQNDKAQEIWRSKSLKRKQLLKGLDDTRSSKCSRAEVLEKATSDKKIKICSIKGDSHRVLEPVNENNAIKRKIGTDTDCSPETKHPHTTKVANVSKPSASALNAGRSPQIVLKESSSNSESTEGKTKRPKKKMYACIHSNCDFRFEWNETEMKKHIRDFHPYYSCGYCHAAYGFKKQLQNHLRFVHSGEKPLVLRDDISLEELFQPACNNKKTNGMKDSKNATKEELAKPQSASNLVNDQKKSSGTDQKQLHELQCKSTVKIQGSDTSLSDSTAIIVIDDDCDTPDSVSDVQPDTVGSTKMSPVFVDKNLVEKVKETSVNQQSNIVLGMIEVKDDSRLTHFEKQHITEKPSPKASSIALCSNSKQMELSSREKEEFKSIVSGQRLDDQNAGKAASSFGMSEQKKTSLNALSYDKGAGKSSGSSSTTSRHDDKKMKHRKETLKRKMVEMAASGENSFSKVKMQKQSLEKKNEETKLMQNSNVQNKEGLMTSVSKCTIPKTSVTSSSNVSTLSHGASVDKVGQDGETSTVLKDGISSLAMTEISTPMNSVAAEKKENVANCSKMKNFKNKYRKKVSLKDFPYRCANCEVCFRSVSDAKEHFRWLHTKENVKLMDRKHKFAFTSSGEWSGSSLDKGLIPEQHLCNYCPFRSESRSDTEKHLKESHADRTMEIISLYHHHQQPLDSSQGSQEDRPASATVSRSSSGHMLYCCHLCSEVSDSEFFFKLHLAKHPGFKHNMVLTSTATLLVCPTCNYIAKSNSDLAQHTGQHMIERRFMCSMCDSDSHNKKGLEAHIRKAHFNDDGAEVIDRQKLYSVNLKPKMVSLDPKVALVDPFKSHPSYFSQLVQELGIKVIGDLPHNMCEDFLGSHEDTFFDILYE